MDIKNTLITDKYFVDICILVLKTKEFYINYRKNMKFNIEIILNENGYGVNDCGGSNIFVKEARELISNEVVKSLERKPKFMITYNNSIGNAVKKYSPQS